MLMVTAMVMAVVVGPVPACGAAARPRETPASLHEGQKRSASHFIYHEEPGAKLTLETHRHGSPGGGGAGLGNPSFPEFFPERFRGPPPHSRPFPAPARPGPPAGPHSPHPPEPHDAKRGPQSQPKPRPPPKPQHPASQEKQVFANEGPGGCMTSEGFYFAGQTWYVKGCRRRTCIHFRGSFITETDSCDSEIFNTTYKCIVQVDTNAEYPDCCPTYRCNPDNLGNSVN